MSLAVSLKQTTKIKAFNDIIIYASKWDYSPDTDKKKNCQRHFVALKYFVINDEEMTAEKRTKISRM